jgi:hypothetical protein
MLTYITLLFGEYTSIFYNEVLRRICGPGGRDHSTLEVTVHGALHNVTS